MVSPKASQEAKCARAAQGITLLCLLLALAAFSIHDADSERKISSFQTTTSSQQLPRATFQKLDRSQRDLEPHWRVEIRTLKPGLIHLRSRKKNILHLLKGSWEMSLPDGWLGKPGCAERHYTSWCSPWLLQLPQPPAPGLLSIAKLCKRRKENNKYEQQPV